MPGAVARMAIRNSGYGLDMGEHTSVLDPKNHVAGHYYLDRVKTDEDIEKIRAPVVSPDARETALRETIEACRAHGCTLELIHKDISTVRHAPERLWQWEKIAKRLVMDAVRPDMA